MNFKVTNFPSFISLLVLYLRVIRFCQKLFKFSFPNVMNLKSISSQILIFVLHSIIDMAYFFCKSTIDQTIFACLFSFIYLFACLVLFSYFLYCPSLTLTLLLPFGKER